MGIQNDMYAVVLYFDAAANVKLQEAIDGVATTTGNNYMIDVNIPPHITVGAFLGKESEKLRGAVEAFVKGMESFSITFDSIKAFEPRVLFVSPIKDKHLEYVNIQLNEQLLRKFQPADNEYYTPEKWIPHCALAVRLDEQQFQKAKTAGENLELPIIANVERIALARCNPYEEIEVWRVKHENSSN